MPTLPLSTVVTVLFLFIDVSKAGCYLPNGTDTNLAHETENQYLSCNHTWPGAQHSMCCRTAAGQDTCLDNGLCQNVPVGPDSLIWRESCTDPTWEDPGCLRLYIDGDGESASTPVQKAAKIN